MNHALLILCVLFFTLTSNGQSFSPSITSAPFTIGHTLKFHSSILDEERELNVYLPEGYYDDTLKRYPVIYLLDGSREEDFIHIAGICQFSQFSWIQRMPEAILVGIVNIDRKRDYTYPTTIEADKKEFPTTGGSEVFISYLRTNVFNIINNQYRTNDSRSIIGQSLGGLLATEILFQHQEMFDNYFIISPSLWWDNESLLVKELKLNKNTSVHIAVGNEGEIMTRTARELYEKAGQKAAQNQHVSFNYYEKNDHGDVLHQAIYDALPIVFKKESKTK